jgi:hypothetical protein
MIKEAIRRSTTVKPGPDSIIDGRYNSLEVAQAIVYPILKRKIVQALEPKDSIKTAKSIRAGFSVIHEDDQPVVTILVQTTSSIGQPDKIYALDTRRPVIQRRLVEDLADLPPERNDLMNLEQNGGEVVGITSRGSRLEAYTVWGEEQQQLDEAVENMFDMTNGLLEHAARPKTTCDSIIRVLLPKTAVEKLFSERTFKVSEKLLELEG